MSRLVWMFAVGEVHVKVRHVAKYYRKTGICQHVGNMVALPFGNRIPTIGQGVFLHKVGIDGYIAFVGKYFPQKIFE